MKTQLQYSLKATIVLSGILWILFLSFLPAKAQTYKIPPGLNYQAVARDENGYPIGDKEIVILISIISGNESGPVEWQEVHRVRTEESGFFSLVIGSGISTHTGRKAKFDDIDWGAADYYMKVSVDFGSSQYGNAILDMGVAKLQSVPYAFMSRRSFKADIADSALNVPKLPTFSQLLKVNEANLTKNDVVQWDGTKWATGQISVNIPVSTDFVRKDGTTDLTADWTIKDRNITLTNGTLKAKSLQSTSLNTTSLTTNTLSTNTLTATSINTGTLTSNSLNLSGNSVSGISADATLGGLSPGDNLLATQKAIKTYIDSKPSGGGGYWTLDGMYLYAATESGAERRIGIGTATPIDKFHTELGGYGFLVTGVYDKGQTPVRAYGPGVRMGFFPSRGAFRAGGVENSSTVIGGSNWDDTNIGDYSVAMGWNTMASGKYSVSLGANNQAIGERTFVMGRANMALGVGTTIFGDGNKTDGAYSLAIGNVTTATGDYSFAMGKSTQATGTGSIACGNLTTAQGPNSFALGLGSATYSLAESSIAGGSYNKSYGKYSVSLGYYNKANSFAEVVIGQYNTNYDTDVSGDVQWKTKDRVFNIGIGTAEAQRADAMIVYKDGRVVISKTLQVASTTYTSDARFKRNVTPINHALDKILAMNGVSFEWETNKFPERLFPDGRHFGFLAQDVEKIIPEIVATDDKGFKSVDYSITTALLVEAIKEQQRQIEILKNENNDLKNKSAETEQLKTQLNELQKKVNMLMELYLKGAK